MSQSFGAATRISRDVLIGLLAVGGFQALAAQQDYANSTTPTSATAWSTSYAGETAVGQSFTVAGSTLNAFGFYASSNWTGSRMFQAFLLGMSGSFLTGSALYISSALNYTSITTGWFDFFTGGLGLAAGNVYMAILAPVSASYSTAVMNLGVKAGDVYAGGAGAHGSTAPAATVAGLLGTIWVGLNVFPGKDDFAFRVDYELASVALVATGLIGLVGAGWVRRKRQGSLAAGWKKVNRRPLKGAAVSLSPVVSTIPTAWDSAPSAR